MTVFLLGPFFTNMSIIDYITDLATYKYLLNAILIPIHSLPGVFENNIYGNVINGALWTLPIEFICYIALMICYKLKLLNKNILYTFPISLIFFYLFYYSNIQLFSSLSIYTLPIFIYYMGMLYYVFKDKIILNNGLAAFLVVIWFGLVYFGFAEIAMFIIFPYIISVIVFNKKQCNRKLSELGNFSYGIYLCGFPIQQIMVYLFGGKMNVYINMIVSIVLAIIVGYFIYFISEQKLKKYSV
ncbi:acyltransferase family protein [uncultured Traorella sp.]|uniref:acyltransferase family protein n=1 Tax=uncultured Traorella sp. TaxID=1929048 RepID=UPI003419641B